eukprot:2457585-Heterocapsa_arctica.AAC.1
MQGPRTGGLPAVPGFHRERGGGLHRDGLFNRHMLWFTALSGLPSSLPLPFLFHFLPPQSAPSRPVRSKQAGRASARHATGPPG